MSPLLKATGKPSGFLTDLIIAAVTAAALFGACLISI